LTGVGRLFEWTDAGCEIAVTSSQHLHVEGHATGTDEDGVAGMAGVAV
jgi:hypothetical protein